MTEPLGCGWRCWCRLRETTPAELRHLADRLRNAPHLMHRDDLDRAAWLLDRLAAGDLVVVRGPGGGDG